MTLQTFTVLPTLFGFSVMCGHLWTPFRRLHGRIAELARQRDQALLRFEQLVHKDLSQAAQKSPQALELQIRMLQSLPLRLKGQKSLITALFRPFKPGTAVLSWQTRDFARDECESFFILLLRCSKG